MPAVSRAEKRMTSPATPRYGAMTRATGSEMAIAATFMIKLVMIITKKAMPRIKTMPEESLNSCSQLIASHFAAPVSQRQKPIDMAPENSRTIFQGISSRSLRVRIFKTKKADGRQQQDAGLIEFGESRNKVFQGDNQDNRKDYHYHQNFILGPFSQIIVHGLRPLF